MNLAKPRLIPALALIVSLALGVTWSKADASQSGPLISAHGVGPLHLGATAASLESKDAIGPLQPPLPGCEPASGKRIAYLHISGAEGFGVFNRASKRLVGILIFGGKAETASQVHLGTTPKQALRAYPQAKYEEAGFDPTTGRPTPGIIWVNSRSHPKMTFEVPSEGGTAVSAIFVPSPRICE